MFVALCLVWDVTSVESSEIQHIPTLSTHPLQSHPCRVCEPQAAFQGCVSFGSISNNSSQTIIIPAVLTLPDPSNSSQSDRTSNINNDVKSMNRHYTTFCYQKLCWWLCWWLCCWPTITELTVGFYSWSFKYYHESKLRRRRHTWLTMIKLAMENPSIKCYLNVNYIESYVHY